MAHMLAMECPLLGRHFSDLSDQADDVRSRGAKRASRLRPSRSEFDRCCRKSRFFVGDCPGLMGDRDRGQLGAAAA
jgi:hypothetical protein